MKENEAPQMQKKHLAEMKQAKQLTNLHLRLHRTADVFNSRTRRVLNK